MRNIGVITGTRAEYGVLQPLLGAIEGSRSLRLSLIATSMHLSKDFGRTVREITSDGHSIACLVKTLTRDDTGAGMARSIGRCMAGMADAFEENAPDIVVVTGDRGEMLAAAIAGMYMNIPVVHIHGGDVSGSVDDSIRHAITKVAHVHFAATKSHMDRLLRLGEERWRVHRVGTLALDSLRRASRLPIGEVEQRFGVDLSRPLALMLQHTVTTDAKNAGKQASITLDALEALGLQTIVIYPNADAGGRRIIKAIEARRGNPLFHIHRSVAHEDFINLMRVSSVLVGNSSAGIIEAPFFRLPVVNIGPRQDGRERALNVIDTGYDRRAILRALERAVHDETFKRRLKGLRNPHGKGDTSQRIVMVLSGLKLDRRLLEKRITY